MPARPELQRLIEALGGSDEIARESAVARLALIGPRAAERLVQAFPSAAPRVRAGMLRALEGLADPRAVRLARVALADQSLDLVLAAIGVLRAFLNAPQAELARDALDAVVAVALDT